MIDNSQDGIADKKLWLDYLGKLKDRQDRANQVTGVTNWVLYGLIGTICYKGMGLLPALIFDRDFRYNSGLLIILALNFIVPFRRCLLDFIPRIREGTSDIRKVPARISSLVSGYAVYLAAIYITLGAVEVCIWRNTPHRPQIVHLSFLLFGAKHIGLALLLALYWIIEIWVKKSDSVPLPHFRPSGFPGDRYLQLFSLLVSGLGAASCISFLRIVIRNSSTWLQSVEVVVCTLVLCWAIYRIIVLWPTQQQIASGITELEQQILLENLDASEIRMRFVQQIAGSGLHDWLQESSHTIESAFAVLKCLLENAESEIREVNLLPDAQERVQKLVNLKARVESDLPERLNQLRKVAMVVGATAVTQWTFRGVSLKASLEMVKKRKDALGDLGSQLKAIWKQFDEVMSSSKEEILRGQDQLSEATPGI